MKNSNKSSKRKQQKRLTNKRSARGLTLYRNLISDILSKDINVSYNVYAVLTNNNQTLYSFSSSFSQTGSNNRQDILATLFTSNGEFDRLRSNFTFIKIDNVRLRVSNQLGFSNKVLVAPPTWFTLYPTSSVPFSTVSIAQLDQAVKHEFHANRSTDVIYNLPSYLEYMPDMPIGSNVWIPLRTFNNYLYFYVGFGYFDAPILDVAAASAIPLISVEVSLRTHFACPILAS